MNFCSASSRERWRCWPCSAPKRGLSAIAAELLGRIADNQERIARARQRITQLRAEALQRTIEELEADRNSAR